MTLTELRSTFETFNKDLEQSKDYQSYSKAALQAINEFYFTNIQKTKEELIAEMVASVTKEASN